MFVKYLDVQKRKQEEKERAAEEQLVQPAQLEPRGQREGSGRGMKFLQIALLVVVVAGGTYYFTAGRQPATVGQPSSNSAVSVTPAKPDKPDQTLVRQPQNTSTPEAKPPQRASGDSSSAIEKARRSTVSIETPWGTGSGFFIDNNFIVTNKHVVTFDPEKLSEFRSQIENARKMIELEQQKIRELRQRMRQLPKGPTRSQLALIIKGREENLAKIMPEYEEGERRLKEMEVDVQPSDITIILSDGTEQAANYLLVSDNYDLALLALYAGEYPPIERGPVLGGMRQGDKVFTIGSPVGLRHTVTSGIFSGYRRYEKDGVTYLQTDAPINPGNSGGPLIDEHGYIQGVNTMVLRNTEGIGFAIPIDVVFDEFSSTLF